VVIPVGPRDHIRGEGPETIVYLDLCCPHCAAVWPRLTALEAKLVFRHFPVVAKHPRSPAPHAAAEAAGGQGAFFEMIDSLLADRSRVDDPHLWERATALGLDIASFDAERRSEETMARVRHDIESGLAAGVADTLAIFRDGRAVELEALYSPS
jgi:protein-disulfide isomerase